VLAETTAARPATAKAVRILTGLLMIVIENKKDGGIEQKLMSCWLKSVGEAGLERVDDRSQKVTILKN